MVSHFRMILSQSKCKWKGFQQVVRKCWVFFTNLKQSLLLWKQRMLQFLSKRSGLPIISLGSVIYSLYCLCNRFSQFVQVPSASVTDINWSTFFFFKCKWYSATFTIFLYSNMVWSLPSSYKIITTEQFGLERTLKIIEFQPPCDGQGYHTLHQAA